MVTAVVVVVSDVGILVGCSGSRYGYRELLCVVLIVVVDRCVVRLLWFPLQLPGLL